MIQNVLIYFSNQLISNKIILLYKFISSKSGKFLDLSAKLFFSRANLTDI